MRKVIANTTPLIALANIDQLELLHKLYGTIIIPQAVMDEKYGNDRPGKAQTTPLVMTRQI